ncbi:MAG: TRM11 family SAM-dependent methyltransferase [Terrimicrobiaceae bacterium]
MKSAEQMAAKALYKSLRGLSWSEIWNVEVPRFNRSNPEERFARVAVIRAVGVVFSESAPPSDSDVVRAWLRALLKDPNEKIRRYAMAALPKVGAGFEEEAEMLGLLQSTQIEREKKFLADSLDKIGADQTLAVVQGRLPQTEQKARAAVARRDNPGQPIWDEALEKWEGLRIHLRGRRGLEQFVREEVEAGDVFRVLTVSDGVVEITPRRAFSLGDIFSLRCFGTLGIVLGDGAEDELPAIITSDLSREILRTFTAGPVRYRLDFVGKGHQRGAVRTLANRIFSECPSLLNDPRAALWSVDIRAIPGGQLVEVRPRVTPDPRFAYRRQFLPAASHPPLAASMARLAGSLTNAVVWDPFCGSGVELIECSLRGGVRTIVGTDLSADALVGAQENFSTSDARDVDARFLCCDFRDFGKVAGLAPASVDLVITNPPLGMRVPVPNLRGLIADLFAVAAEVLRPGGRLVFTNPLRVDESPQPGLVRESSRLVDMSGFSCRLERYVKVGGGDLSRRGDPNGSQPKRIRYNGNTAQRHRGARNDGA